MERREEGSREAEYTVSTNCFSLGSDATRDFEGMFHSRRASVVLEEFRIGDIEGGRGGGGPGAGLLVPSWAMGHRAGVGRGRGGGVAGTGRCVFLFSMITRTGIQSMNSGWNIMYLCMYVCISLYSTTLSGIDVR